MHVETSSGPQRTAFRSLRILAIGALVVMILLGLVSQVWTGNATQKHPNLKTQIRLTARGTKPKSLNHDACLDGLATKKLRDVEELWSIQDNIEDNALLSYVKSDGTEATVLLTPRALRARTREVDSLNRAIRTGHHRSLFYGGRSFVVFDDNTMGVIDPDICKLMHIFLPDAKGNLHPQVHSMKKPMEAAKDKTETAIQGFGTGNTVSKCSQPDFKYDCNKDGIRCIPSGSTCTENWVVYRQIGCACPPFKCRDRTTVHCSSFAHFSELKGTSCPVVETPCDFNHVTKPSSEVVKQTSAQLTTLYRVAYAGSSLPSPFNVPFGVISGALVGTGLIPLDHQNQIAHVFETLRKDMEKLRTELLKCVQHSVKASEAKDMKDWTEQVEGHLTPRDLLLSTPLDRIEHLHGPNYDDCHAILIRFRRAQADNELEWYMSYAFETYQACMLAYAVYIPDLKNASRPTSLVAKKYADFAVEVYDIVSRGVRNLRLKYERHLECGFFPSQKRAAAERYANWMADVLIPMCELRNGIMNFDGQCVPADSVCIEDRQLRVLHGKHVDSSSMTIGYCSRICHGYKYFGLQRFRHCFCGNTLRGAVVYKPSTECSDRCDGNHAQMCGGSWRLSLYEMGGKCIVDRADRVLKGPHTNSNTMTVGECSRFCGAYKYFGVQFASHCFCGNSLHGEVIYKPSEECQMTCQGNHNEFCGGAWRMNLYQHPD